jgi:Zn-dependent peptidase ImmA (M78 family)
MARWGSEYGKLESEANDFAATLLMPLDDFRRQIDPREKPDIDELVFALIGTKFRSSLPFCDGYNTQGVVPFL